MLLALVDAPDERGTSICTVPCDVDLEMCSVLRWSKEGGTETGDAMEDEDAISLSVTAEHTADVLLCTVAVTDVELQATARDVALVEAGEIAIDGPAVVGWSGD